MPKPLLIGLVALVASVGAVSAGDGWRTYANPRFGVSVEYPTIFSVRDPEPDNSDGQGFRTADGRAKLAVFGRYNVDDASIGKIMQSYKEPGTDYTYAKATAKWFVLSGAKGGVITYLRCNLGGSDVVGCVEFKYPSADAAKWSAAVGRVGNSLRVGS